jgi:hypothetical protein
MYRRLNDYMMWAVNSGGPGYCCMAYDNGTVCPPDDPSTPLSLPLSLSLFLSNFHSVFTCMLLYCSRAQTRPGSATRASLSCPETASRPSSSTSTCQLSWCTSYCFYFESRSSTSDRRNDVFVTKKKLSICQIFAKTSAQSVLIGRRTSTSPLLATFLEFPTSATSSSYVHCTPHDNHYHISLQ